MSEKRFDGSFYDKDYFQNGKKSGKGWLEGYHFMPQRSIREALAFVDYMEIDENSKVLDFGCAYGFLVRAFRMLEVDVAGCDISDFALSHSPYGCWNCSDEREWKNHEGAGYTHVVCKDVLEHLTSEQLHETMIKLSRLAKKMMVVIPMGDNGLYRIPEYHTEISHIIAEDENWWMLEFEKAGWKTVKHCNHVNGLKDNWLYCENGNHVFVLEYIG